MERRIHASQLRLAAHHPFFSALLLMAPVEVSDRFDTAATDGSRLYFNPGFMAQLSSAQLDGLVVHELLHCAMLHLQRRKHREPHLWNVAADIHVNGAIRQLKHLDLPAGCVERPKLAHLCVEEIYELLQREPRRGASRAALGIRDLADPHDAGADALTPEEAERLAAYWSDAMHRARAVSNATQGSHGSVPACISRMIDDAHGPSLDWRTALWRYVVRTSDDFTDFDRRHLWQGLYVETLEGTGLHVDVCIDTSGSVNDAQLGDFLGELRGILGSYPGVRCRLYYADAACTGPFDVSVDRPLPVASGGGGTDFRPFFSASAPGAGDAIEEWMTGGHRGGDAPSLAVYLTDGMGVFPPEAPDRPVLWVLTPGGVGTDAVPFGEVVRMVERTRHA